jgi:hypothetical protein
LGAPPSGRFPQHSGSVPVEQGLRPGHGVALGCVVAGGARVYGELSLGPQRRACANGSTASLRAPSLSSSGNNRPSSSPPAPTSFSSTRGSVSARAFAAPQQGRIRQLPAPHIDTPTRQHPHLPRRRESLELVDQTRFPDAGPIERCSHSTELLSPAHERRTRDTPSHPVILTRLGLGWLAKTRSS